MMAQPQLGENLSAYVHSSIFIDDRPITDNNSDALDREPFVDNLIRTLVDEYRDGDGKIQGRSTGLVVGLTGPWGSGKSSVLNLVAEKLNRRKHVAVVVINPWLFQDRRELLEAFFKELRHALGKSAGDHARDLIATLDKYKAAIGIGLSGAVYLADLHGGFGLMSSIVKPIKAGLAKLTKPKDRTAEDERHELENKLEQHRLAVVVLIDEVDRVENSEVRAVAQLIKAVGDIKGISYLVAYDPERVVDALGRGEGDERRKSGEAYLEKIIQYPVPLRPLFDDDVTAMLTRLLAQHGLNLPEDMNEDDRAIINLITRSVKTPRELKRLTGAYAVLEPMVHGEIRATDILGYCWLLTKSPTLRDLIAANFDRLVDDPVEHEMLARIERHRNAQSESRTEWREGPVEVLGQTAGRFQEILRLLFPRFRGSRNRAEGDRLSLRRNLVRLLYLGNPPGAASVAEITTVWQMPSTDIEQELRDIMASSHLAPFIDRLDDVIARLPADQDIPFWTALARVFVRQQDWLQGPNTMNAIADDAATSLMRLAIRDRRQSDRVKTVVHALIAAGDLTIVPWILRKHMFAHGVATGIPARGGETVYTREETEALLDAETPRYRTAVLDGTALRRISNMEATFCLNNSNRWDEDLRRSLTDQLADPNARATFAGLVTPPGYLVDRRTLDELFDTDTVSAEMTGDEGGHDPWLAGSVARMQRVLQGRDINGED